MLFRAALIALALLGLVAAIYAAGANSMKPSVKALALKVAAAEKSRDAWKGSFDQSESYRKQEAGLYQDGLAQSRQACDASLEAVRKAEVAKRKVHAKPIPMKDGCPVRQLVAASELGLK
jgi:hypothetical protein